MVAVRHLSTCPQDHSTGSKKLQLTRISYLQYWLGPSGKDGGLGGRLTPRKKLRVCVAAYEGAGDAFCWRSLLRVVLHPMIASCLNVFATCLGSLQAVLLALTSSIMSSWYKVVLSEKNATTEIPPVHPPSSPHAPHQQLSARHCVRRLPVNLQIPWIRHLLEMREE